MDAPLNVLGIEKPGGEIYVYLFDDSADSRRELLDTIWLHAIDPELSLDWHDADALEKRLAEIISARGWRGETGELQPPA